MVSHQEYITSRRFLIITLAFLAASFFIVLFCTYENKDETDVVFVTPTPIKAKVVEQPKIQTITTVEQIDHTISSDVEETRLFNDEDAYLLAKIAMAEAEGEDTKGKALVMNVILNRVNDTTFPNTVSEVIFQENQFAPVSNGRFDNVEPNEDCWKALEMVKQGYDESNGALYFSSNMSSDSWHNIALSLLFVYGNHQFYK